MGMNACRLLGHHFRFTAVDETMLWTCTRGCGVGGRKTYADAATATRYAAAMNTEDSADIGRRAPILGMFPLRLWRLLRRRR